MTEVVTLRTSRTLLRPWRDGDREAFAAMNADPTVMEHFPEPLTQEASDEFADGIVEDLERDGWGRWALELPGELGFAGFVGLGRVRFTIDVAFGEEPPIEIGWRLPVAAWGKGYASEAALAVLEFAFGPLGRREVISFTTPNNTRSRRVMERIGMSHVPEDDFVHPRMIERGFPDLAAHVLYRADDATWQARRTG